MRSLFRYVAPPGQCGYLPDQTWRLEYEVVNRLSPSEYMEQMLQGWRRFGNALFHPRCPACTACRSLRIVVERFRPNRSHGRVGKVKREVLHLRTDSPSGSRAKLELYGRYHA